MRLTTRIHEWLAERVTWIQFPVHRYGYYRPTLYERFQNLSGKQRAWTVCGLFWAAVVFCSIVGRFFP